MITADQAYVRRINLEIRSGYRAYLRLGVTGSMSGYTDKGPVTRLRCYRGQLQAKSATTGEWITFERGNDWVILEHPRRLD